MLLAFELEITPAVTQAEAKTQKPMEARPLNVAKSQGFANKEIEVFLDGISYIKNGGPSPGGKGHMYANVHSLEGIKNSGPSPPGEGHYHTSSAPRTVGGIKHSGPRPGQGNYYH
ncbi:hypothetical protein GH714_012453 [Hevea brasiliensis]|uniref:Uncharacterized protein n=1 Tax=Hevea brasiliensis TaxID=3981 RepID=A0A6A6NGR6_HEVBR|nr:hypothetical protein GH714_012453 [Hevea brasiliensis]